MSNSKYQLFTATLATALMLGAGQVARAAGPAPVALGASAPFAVLAKTGISTVPASAVTGDLGTSPIDSTAITGFSLILDSTNTFSRSSQVTGKVYAADYASPTPSNLTAAVSNMEAAYTDAAGRPLPDFTELYSGDLSGQTLVPGLYKWSTGVLINSNMTLAGAGDGVWIFQIAGDITVGSGARVQLSGGANAKNVFWQVGGGTGVEIGTTAHVEGTILAMKAIHLRTGASLNGRALAQSAVTLDGNTVAIPVFTGPCGRGVRNDFDGDGKADLAVFRPRSGDWFIERSSTDQTISLHYGNSNATATPGDYDGDGKTDIAFYLENSGLWFVRHSSTGVDTMSTYGGPGYKPQPRDYDGDGRDDIAVYHPGSGVWYVRNSTTGLTTTVGYGGPDYTPVPADYDGNCKDDIAVYQEATSLWYVRLSAAIGTASSYGGPGFKPVPRDYAGDGTADLAVFHPASGKWYVRDSTTGQTTTTGYGGPNSTPVPAHYDADTKADIAVYYQAGGYWYIRQSSTGSNRIVKFGGPEYLAVN